MSVIPVSFSKNPSMIDHHVVRTVNGNLEFGLNIKSSTPLSVQAPGVANTEFTITHKLGFVPNGYIVVGKDQTCDVYDSRRSSWTTSQMFLKCTVASVHLVLIVV
jgi:hypothetical protein